MTDINLPHQYNGRLTAKLGTAIAISVRRQMKKQLASYNLTASQTDILVYLQFRDGRETIQKDIEKYTELTNPTISGILTRLEKNGMILRTPSPTVPTAKNIVLTEKSRALKDTLIKAVREIEEILSQGIPREDLDTFNSVMLQMHKNIRDHFGPRIFET